MIVVGRFRRNHQSPPDDHGTDDVGEGFRRIRDECLGVAEDAGRKFAGGQHEVHRRPDQRDPERLLQPLPMRHKRLGGGQTRPARSAASPCPGTM